MKIPDNVTVKVRSAPDSPGCYLMRDVRGKIIYVGKAVSLRKRLQSYFRPSTLMRADPKLRGLIKSVADLDFVVVRNEAEAVLTEGRLIKEYKPRYNVSFRDDKRFLLIRGDNASKFPFFSLARIDRNDGAIYFGPYASSAVARTAVDFVEKKFGIRKCRPVLPDEKTYKHCLNDIIRHCSAPCVGRVSESEYKARFEEACAFLRGERPIYLADIKKQMEEMACEKKYEKAASLRDTYFLLTNAARRKSRMIGSPILKKEEALRGCAELADILGAQREFRLIEAFDISNISGTFAVGSMVCAVDGMPARSRYRRFKIRTVTGADDPAMMAEVVRRHYTRVAAGEIIQPDLLLVDGGQTQLSAATRVLVELGMGHIPSVGLAEKQEEIYKVGESVPVVLDRNSAAMKVLIRLRDEAHRFAIDYHRSLRAKLIRESLLDDIEGVGPRKKTALLLKFGSVSRMEKASKEEIARVPGIGYKLAGQILNVLKKRKR